MYLAGTLELKTEKQSAHSDYINSVAFSPDGKTLASGSRDNTIRLWNAATGKEILKIEEHPSDVNSIAFTPDGRIGHNTDAVGFRRAIAPFLEGHHDRALVLGTGGSSAAVVHVLRAIGIDVTRVSRIPSAPGDIAYTDIGREGLAATPLLVNCTPVGMHPDVDGIPPLSEAALAGFGPQHFVVDLIYNPRETALMKRASALGARTLDGFSMLQLQADAAWEIWTGDAATP